MSGSSVDQIPAAGRIDSPRALDALYAPPTERVIRKQLPALDAHCRRFIALSPFLVLATGNAAGALDASPRGGAPGFAKVTGEGVLLIPDAPGNNRLDSLRNLVAHRGVGLLFMVPGLDETLRVNGHADLSRDPADIATCADQRRAPKLVIRVTVSEAFMHCAKAFMRSRLWDPGARVAPDAFPPIGRVISEQTGTPVIDETREQMIERYRLDL